MHLDAGAPVRHRVGPVRRRRRHLRGRRQRRHLRPGHAQGRVQRLLHHQLLRADGQGARRRLRRREGPHDHGPRLHRHPVARRRPVQGPARGPGRGHQHHPQLHRRRPGHQPGARVDEGEARRHLAAGAGARRLHHRLHRRARPRRSPSTRSTTPSGPPPRAARCRKVLVYNEAPDRELRHRRLAGLAAPSTPRSRWPSATWSRSWAGTTTSGATRTAWSTSSRSPAPSSRARPWPPSASPPWRTCRRSRASGSCSAPTSTCPCRTARITDDLRIRAALPTIEWLQEQGATVVTACTHFGRPKGEPDPTVLGGAGPGPPGRAGARRRAAREPALRPGRGGQRPRRSSPGWSTGFDAYVNDAFGASHRAHASIVGPPQHLPSAAGRLLAREVEVLLRPARAPDPARSWPCSAARR